MAIAITGPRSAKEGLVVRSLFIIAVNCRQTNNWWKRFYGGLLLVL